MWKCGKCGKNHGKGKSCEPDEGAQDRKGHSQRRHRDRREKLENAAKIIEKITGKKATKTLTMKRIPDFGIRPMELIGCKLTLRGKEAEDFLKRAFTAAENKINEWQFDENGNFSFGVKEHIDLPGVKYEPALGIIGMDVCVTVGRRGYRVKRRRMKQAKIGAKHRLGRNESIDFVKNKFNVKVVSKEQLAEET